jgi:hypothetical protein
MSINLIEKVAVEVTRDPMRRRTDIYTDVKINEAKLGHITYLTDNMLRTVDSDYVHHMVARDIGAAMLRNSEHAVYQAVARILSIARDGERVIIKNPEVA